MYIRLPVGGIRRFINIDHISQCWVDEENILHLVVQSNKVKIDELDALIETVLHRILSHSGEVVFDPVDGRDYTIPANDSASQAKAFRSEMVRLYDKNSGDTKSVDQPPLEI